MSKEINPNLAPHTGYSFKCSDGVTLYGDSWAGVIVRLKSYRQRAGLPPGDPEKEVMQYACDKNPNLCRDNNDAAYTDKLKVATLKSRVLAWLTLAIKHLRSGQLEWTDKYVAQRSAVCAECPFNRAIEEGCSSCRAALAEMRTQAAGIRPHDGRLNQCIILGEDLNAAVWLDVVTAAVPELPDHCWRKRRPM